MTDPRLSADSARALDGPVGIGGWLLLHLIGNLGFTVRDLFDGFDAQFLAALIAGSNETAVAMRLPILLSYLDSVALIAMALFGLWGMITRSPKTPEIMVGFYLTCLIAAVIEAAAYQWIQSIAGGASGSDGAKVIGRAALGCVIWIPYFRVSRRVRNTFRPHPAAVDGQVVETFT